MKRSDNTEMDRLLRRHARLGGERLREPFKTSGSETTAAAHLDADELNAYAEGALSDAARSRYFAHLADCDSCRKLVTDLTLAAQVTVEGRERAAIIETQPSRSWRDWLAAVFSPPVLRYGVPALVLFAVIAVAFLATRTNREATSVSQQTGESRNYERSPEFNSNSAGETATATGAAESHSDRNSNNPLIASDQQSQTRPEVSATPLPPMKSAPVQENEPVATQADSPKPAEARTSDTKESPGVFGMGGNRKQADQASPPPPPAAQPPVLATTPAAPTTEMRSTREEQKKNKLADKDDNGAVVGGSVADESVAKKAESGRDKRAGEEAPIAATSRAAQNAPRSRRAPAAKSGPADGVTEREDTTETRGVGGRHFRRQGNAWVDTAYNSSRQTTHVARGSEQYRALVADEPGLRTITQQLGGEVIVVWKGRAYRFY
ncbi:MAG TPA: zf-HC2 domain-containing protein [Pyrinomonadaceae bacterium]|nr:zf-HC2 domain-containing protein [Pyrinomonadaceae bacterium]